MVGIGGATSGHAWREIDLVENHAWLNAGLLQHAGALVPGALTVWRWPDGGMGYVRATRGEIFLSGSRAQSIRFDYIPIMRGRMRPRLLCPLCGRGAYHLHDKGGLFACRRCCGYDWRCRHRRRYNPFVEETDGRSRNRSYR